MKELQERVRVERPVGERRDLPVGRRGVRAQGLRDLPWLLFFRYASDSSSLLRPCRSSSIYHGFLRSHRRQPGCCCAEISKSERSLFGLLHTVALQRLSPFLHNLVIREDFLWCGSISVAHHLELIGHLPRQIIQFQMRWGVHFFPLFPDTTTPSPRAVQVQIGSSTYA